MRHLDFTLNGRCHPRSKRGGATIGMLELNREGLVEQRRDIFAYLLQRLRMEATARLAGLLGLRGWEQPTA